METLNISDLEIKEELHSLNLGVSHFKVFNSKLNIRGHGSDFNKELALKKALHEYVERFHFRQYLVKVGFQTTSGIAAHINEPHSKDSATNELLERHVFITHWLQGISPSWINNKAILDQLLSEGSSAILEKISEQNFIIRFGVLAKVGDIFVAIGIIKKNKETGFAVACSSDKSIPAAIEKCLIDSIRVADLLESRRKNGLSLFTKMSSSQVNNPEDHLEYYLNEENWIGLDWFFESSSDVRSYDRPSIETMSWTDDKTLPWPVHLSFALSSQLQNLYFGETNEENIHTLNRPYVKNHKLHPFA